MEKDGLGGRGGWGMYADEGLFWWYQSFKGGEVKVSRVITVEKHVCSDCKQYLRISFIYSVLK